MTNAQYKIFASVRKHRTLPKILAATGIADYMELQNQAGAGMLLFSNCSMDSTTKITLSNAAAEQYEERRRTGWKEFRAWVTLAIAVWGAFTGTIALFLR